MVTSVAMQSLTIPVSSLDWKFLTKVIQQLGRLTEEEIDPITWRKAFNKVGVTYGGDLTPLAVKAEEMPYLLITFTTPNLKTVKQRITFSGAYEPVRFEAPQ